MRFSIGIFSRTVACRRGNRAAAAVLIGCRFGAGACPMSALADWEESNALLASEHRLPEDRTLIGVFRLGGRGGGKVHRARRAAAQLILD
jgi:hypothetical protein